MAKNIAVIHVALEDFKQMKTLFECICEVLNDVNTPAWVKEKFTHAISGGVEVRLKK